MNIIVIKLGGSLLDWDETVERLTRVRFVSGDERAVMIVGGGKAVDRIRAIDRAFGLGEERSHRSALHTLDTTARRFAERLSASGTRGFRCKIAADFASLESLWEIGMIPILPPRRVLDEVEASGERPLEHSWRVTSDSIALWIAKRLKARRLVLLKSVDPPVDASIDHCRDLGLVDPFFPSLFDPSIQVLFYNLRSGSSAILKGESAIKISVN